MVDDEQSFAAIVLEPLLDFRGSRISWKTGASNLQSDVILGRRKGGGEGLTLQYLKPELRSKATNSPSTWS